MQKTRTLKWASRGAMVLLALLMLAAAGCSKQQPAMGPQAVEVKAMPVIQKDTMVNHEFVGQVEAKDEVQVKANVSGNIIEKYVKGGDAVRKGQPLFRIDSRQYESARLDYQSQLADAEANLSRVRKDVERYKILAASNAIAQQSLDNILAEENQAQAKVGAIQARLNQAGNDVQDTIVVSPLDGKVDIKDLSAGNYVQAGQTVLATISSTDAIRVKFSMSENEYLQFARTGAGSGSSNWGQSVKLLLSDGKEYPVAGRVEQIDRGVAQETGTISMKAVFENPQKLLIPGMFARVVAEGEVRKGALLVPQRAVQELLGKTFITVVGAEEKAESRPVKMGPKVGGLWLVEEGLHVGDRVVVEGAAKVQPGAALKVVMVGLEELQTPAKP